MRPLSPGWTRWRRNDSLSRDRAPWRVPRILAAVSLTTGSLGGRGEALARREGSFGAGDHEASLIGEHDELGPVAGVELDHRAADVGLRRGGTHGQPLC